MTVRKRPNSLSLACLIGMFVAAGCASREKSRYVMSRDGARANQSPLVWVASYVPTAPTVDGEIDDVWRQAKPITVTVREALGGTAPISVTLRAMYTEDSLHILATWPDRTPSTMRDPYVWNATTRSYDRPTKPDDQFALEFPLSGDFQINMLNTKNEFIADVWHWKAGRGNPVGWVDDKRHIITQKPTEDTKEYSLGGHAKVYIARPMDEGSPSYVVKPKPEQYVGDVVDSFEPHEPSGSLADVRGRAVHDGQRWTLEMSRRLSTGHSDDVVLDATREIPCAIAVLNDELYWDHSVSELLTLKFERR